MKTTALIVAMLAGLSAGWIAGCNNEVEFVRVVEGRTWALQHYDSSWYKEYVLVKNIPRNKIKQSKIMIAYFDSVGFSIDNLKEIPEINHYCMYFWKSTRATRGVFIEKTNIGDNINANKTYLGDIYVDRCKKNFTKWNVGIGINLGTDPDADYTGGHIKDEYLQNDCDPAWYEVNKNNDLVKYYMGLINKRTAVDSLSIMPLR
jgi:hypothetical protein